MLDPGYLIKLCHITLDKLFLKYVPHIKGENHQNIYMKQFHAQATSCQKYFAGKSNSKDRGDERIRREKDELNMQGSVIRTTYRSDH